MRETRVQSLGWEDPLEKEMAIHSSLENPMDGVHGFAKSRTWLSNFTFTGKMIVILNDDKLSLIPLGTVFKYYNQSPEYVGRASKCLVIPLKTF